MKKLRVFALILVLAMVVPMVVACQPGSDMSNAFVIATSSMPKNLNPYGGSNSESFILERIYEPTFDWDDNTNSYSKACIGETVDFNCTDGVGTADPNARKMKITIKEHITWSDGTKLTVDDLTFTWLFLTRWAARKTTNKQGQTTINYTFPVQKGFVVSALDLDNPDDFEEKETAACFEKVSDTELIVTLREKSTAPVRSLLTSIFIIPKHIWSQMDPSEYNGDNLDNPVGCGGHVLDYMSSGEAHLVRYEGYHTPSNYGMDDIYVLREDSAEKALKGLESGEFDAYLQGISTVTAQAIEEEGYAYKDSVKLYKVQGAGINTLLMNCRDDSYSGITSSPVVRQAISLALNQEELIQHALYGYGRPSGPSGTMDTTLTQQKAAEVDASKKVMNPYNPSTTIYEAVPQNLEKALAMLKVYFANNQVKGHNDSTAKTYTYNETSGYFEDAQGNHLKLTIWNKIDTTQSTNTKTRIGAQLAKIGLDYEAKSFGASSETEGNNLKPGCGSDGEYFDIYLWGMSVDISNFDATFEYQLYLNPDGSLPTSTFNYGSFTGDVYTDENVEKWYRPLVNAGLMTEAEMNQFKAIKGMNQAILNLRKAISFDEQLAAAIEIEKLNCGTFYKIPIYTSDYIFAYNCTKWTGWTEVPTRQLMNTETFKNLKLINA